VGGGTRQFEEFVRKDGVFDVKSVQTLQDGSSNIREILQLSFK
jgi:hypothetical protein